MQIALIGSTGGMGTFILEELVARRHEIRAVVRRPDAVLPAPLIKPVVADVYDIEALTEALIGIDVVVSAFNPGWKPGAPPAKVHGGVLTALRA